MKVEILKSEYDLKEDPKVYHNLLQDVRGNIMGTMLSWMEYSRNKKDLNLLENAKKIAPGNHKMFNEIINIILSTMKKENVKGRLLKLIEMLKKSSDFDWADLNRFEVFDNTYLRILNILKRLKV